MVSFGIQANEVEAVLADADRRHSIRRFAGHGPCSFRQLYPTSPWCVSEHGRSIPLADIDNQGPRVEQVPLPLLIDHRFGMVVRENESNGNC